MSFPWARELGALLLVALASLFLAIFIGHVPWVLMGGLFVYAFTGRYQLNRLREWIIMHPAGAPPDLPGAPGEIANEVYRRERELERRRDRMADVLQQFQRVSAAVPDAMVVLFQEGHIQWLNPAAERLLGLRSPRDHGVRVVNLIRNPDFQEYVARGDFSQALTLPSPIAGERQLSAQIIPFGDSLRLLICRDVTHFAKLEEVRRQFVANVSHELRTPVTVLLGFLEALNDPGTSCGDEWQPQFELMYEQAQRMQRLIDDLLVLSKLETSPPTSPEEPVKVPDLLWSLKRLGETLAGADGPEIAIEADASLALLGNAEELQSAFSNLLSNAVRHTPAAGTIRLWWRADEEGVKLSVADTGEGIGPQHLGHLTERFYRVDTARSRAGGGTGLGLSIVKHILQRHQARLAIESRLGKGSTFTCIFPESRMVRLS